MKKNIKGFTLVELLAVIVLLGVVATVGVVATLNAKKNANIKEAKSLETSLTELGKSVYSYELLVGNKKDESYFYPTYKKGQSFAISLLALKNAGYIKDLKCTGKSCEFTSPESNNKTCKGYLLVTKSSDGPTFKGYINCSGLYKTTDYIESNESSTIKLTETFSMTN